MNKILKLKYTIFFVLLLGCARESESLVKVTNGIQTLDYPGVVLVDLPEGTCSGSMITSSVVLTAAHCAENKADTDFMVNGYTSIKLLANRF